MQSNDSVEVLLVSRKFPPSTGGMEEFSYKICEALKDRDDIDIRSVTWGGSNIWLPLVLPLLALKSLLAIIRKRPDVLYVTDGLLSPLSVFFGKLFGIRTVVTVYGLDITYRNLVYQLLVVSTFPHNDVLAPISRAAEQQAVEKGVPGDKLKVIPGGVDTEKYWVENATRTDMETVLRDHGFDADIGDRKVLLSVGRLVERKGFQWFAGEVVPELGEGYVYVICGDGPQMSAVQDAVEEHGLEDRIFALGEVTGRPLNVLYSTADLLIMPNIRVEGDMEGFGLVAVEASSCGTPVIASDMEGMKDSVIEGGNGTRVEPEDPQAFVEAVETAPGNFDRKEVRNFTRKEFGWDKQAERYAAVFKGISE